MNDESGIQEAAIANYYAQSGATQKLLHRRWWQAIKILKELKVTERKQVHMLKYRTSTTLNLLKELKTLNDIERKKSDLRLRETPPKRMKIDLMLREPTTKHSCS